ncbi:MAG TPA: hypothetical protein VLZ30_07555 [Verrucomicrobiae bacterium]|nr:hypothetical protein [Verrucomicrobiae bacterium]
MRIARLNILVAVLQLAAFLLVQADLPISQAVVVRPPISGSGCGVRCCCPPENRMRGACCCSSKSAHARSNYALCASGCSGDGRTSTAPIVVKFQVVLPILTIVFGDDLTRKPILLHILDTPVRSTEPPDPPPRLLVAV